MTEAGRRPDEGPVGVVLTRGFWMAQFEVTQRQWRDCVGGFPAQPPTAQFGLRDDVPVYWVNYAEAEHFCNRLTARAHASRALPTTWMFQLPTEAQWEYACRAGTTTATAFGDTLPRDAANFDADRLFDSRRPTASLRAVPVGGYQGDGWGLYDMHGNIFE